MEGGVFAEGREVPEQGEKSPCVVPPVARPTDPETEQGHAYGDKATDGFRD